MIIAVGLGSYALLALLAAPAVLTRGTWRVHHPRLCLGLWYVIFLTGVSATVASGAIAVGAGWRIQVEQPGYDGDLLAQSFGFGSIDGLDTAVRVLGGVGGWTVLAVAGAMVGFVATKAAELISSQRRLRAGVEDLVARTGYRRDVIAGMPVTYIRGRGPVACTLGGHTREVIISAGLSRVLSETELRAVVEHERAHLRGGHLLLARLALLNQACLPGTRAAHELQRATTLLTELIADDVAARRCGGPALASALTKIGEANPADVTRSTLALRAVRIRQRMALVA